MYDEESFEQWKSSISEKSPIFHFWDMISEKISEVGHDK